jgi:hypothetical protein
MDALAVLRRAAKVMEEVEKADPMSIEYAITEAIEGKPILRAALAYKETK